MSEKDILPDQLKEKISKMSERQIQIVSDFTDFLVTEALVLPWKTGEKHEEKAFYTVKELADLLSVTERTVRVRLERGEIKGVKLEGKGPWRIPLAEVDRVLTGASQFG